MGNQTIRVEPTGRVLWVTLDRPHVINALSSAMLTELTTMFETTDRYGCRALVLRGGGRGFSSGADLRSLANDVDLTDQAAIVTYMARWRRLILAMRQCAIPTVAAVHGPAYGGGLNLALACDLVVVARDARLCQSYIDRAVSTDLGGSYLFPRLAGWGRARRYLLTGEAFDGAEAERIGLAASVVAESELVTEASRLAELLADKDPAAVSEMRRVLDAGESGTLARALEAEGRAIARLLTSDTFRARLKAFASGER